MMESSEFSDSRQHYDSVKPLGAAGASSDAFCVKLFGKLHFLKRLKPEHAADIRYQEALRKEFETGYRLEHPQLVRYISLSDDGILMEYVDGETLTQRLANHPEYFHDKKNADKFLRQLLDVVGYLHSHQVLHLDLKPDNILLTRINDDVKLVDLGCCYTDTFIDTQGCTDSFAAPEQLSGGETDVRTDIYAIGRILELLPCHHIYNNVIARCTAPDKADRYQSVEEVLQEINHRKPYLRYIVLSALLVLVIAVAMLLVLRPARPPGTLSPERTSQSDSVPVVQVPDSAALLVEAPPEGGMTAPTPSNTLATPSEATRETDATEDEERVPGGLPLQKVIPSPVPAPSEVVPSPAPLSIEVVPAPASVPAPSQPSHKKDDATQMKEDLEKKIDKAYRSTIVSFCDSVFPSMTVGLQWERQSSEFHVQVLQIAADISRKYPDVPESVVIHQAESHFLSLVGYVFNRMRENGENLTPEIK